MRRNALTGLDSLDLETREAAEAAARRSGLTLEEWIAATVAGQVAPRAAPATKKPRRRPGDDLETAIAKITKATRHRPNRELEAIIAAAAADGERQTRDHSARTAVALDSVASWIEQAEERLNEANQAASRQQDRLASALSEALAAIKDRLDSVERRLEAEQADPERGRRKEQPAAPMFAEAFSALRNDMAKLIVQVQTASEQALPPVVDEIRAEIDRLQQAVQGLATRDEVAGLENLVRTLTDDLSQARNGQDVLSLATSVSDLQRQIQQASKDISAGLHRRISGEVEELRQKIDQVASSGIDRAVIENLMGQMAEMRQALARMAEPQRIERLSEEITALGRLMAEMRLNQIGRNDFASLKSALEDIRSAMKRSEEAKAASTVPEQLRSLSQRIDQLASRPGPAGPDPIREQLTALTERLSSLAADKSKQSETVAGLMERLSSQVATFSERLPERKDVLDRLDRIEDGLRQVGQDSDTAQIELMLRSVQERLDRAPMSAGSLEGLEQQIEALTAKLQEIGTGGALQHVVHETLSQVKSMRDEAGQIAERAIKAALREVRDSSTPPSSAHVDALRQGFAELKALHASADKRTQQTLKAVHNALETLVTRAPAPLPNVTWTTPDPADGNRSGDGEPPAVRLEAAVRRLHAAAISHVEEVTTSSQEAEAAEAPVEAEEVLLEPGAPRITPPPPPATSFTAAHDGEPSHVRANFIAAARRAVLAAKGDRSVVGDKAAATDDEAPGDSAISNQTLIERIRQTFDNHRRPLLLSLAVLILAAGTMQIVSTSQQSEVAADPQPIAIEQNMAADLPAEPAATAAETTEVGKSLDEPARTADITGSLLEPKALSFGTETPPSFSKRVENIGSVGELPSTLPPSLRDAALIGEPGAVFEVAARLAEGRDTAQNPHLAARLFEKAAQAGLVPAQYRLGNLYEKGFGVARDPSLAKTWYEKAAEGGNARAMHNLGVLLAEGVNGKPDYAAAQRWFLAAAEHGVKDSQYNLGVLLARGLGVGQDLGQSYKWFALAADQGDKEAAKKRDEVGTRLPPTELTAAKAAVSNWKPRAGNPAANDVPPPPQGWTSLQPVPRRG